MPVRLYTPKQGQTIKFSYEPEFADQLRSLGVNAYNRYRVVDVDGEIVHVHHAPLPIDPMRDEPGLISVPLELVKSPLGWQPRYTIYTTDREQAETIVNNWFKRGIVVRISQDMSSGGRGTFQPMDNSEPVHWQYGEVSDAVPAELCAQVFRVVFVIEEEINGYANPSHPDLSAMIPTERKKALDAMRKDGWEIEHFRYAGGGYNRRKETVVHDWAA